MEAMRSQGHHLLPTGLLSEFPPSSTSVAASHWFPARYWLLTFLVALRMLFLPFHGFVRIDLLLLLPFLPFTNTDWKWSCGLFPPRFTLTLFYFKHSMASHSKVNNTTNQQFPKSWLWDEDFGERGLLGKSQEKKKSRWDARNWDCKGRVDILGQIPGDYKSSGDVHQRVKVISQHCPHQGKDSWVLTPCHTPPMLIG